MLMKVEPKLRTTLIYLAACGGRHTSQLELELEVP